MYTIFFFDETPTHEIYTYLPPLSLHDALPIFLEHFFLVVLVDLGVVFDAGDFVFDLFRFRRRFRRHGARALQLGDVLRLEDGRSEEHTSELQSLMRISYAVFCLKKKNNNTITTRHIKLSYYEKTPSILL